MPGGILRAADDLMKVRNRKQHYLEDHHFIFPNFSLGAQQVNCGNAFILTCS